MIVAPPARLGALRILSVVLLALALACRDSSAKSNAASRGAAGADTSDRSVAPPSEVVIAAGRQAYVTEAVATPGSVSGTVTTGTPLQPNAPQPTGRDSGLCGATVPDESVNGQGNALGGAVVWIDGVRRGKSVPLERRMEIESDHCRLSPRVQAGVVASAVNVVGHDDFRQHLRFLAGGERAPRASVLLGQDEQVIPTELPFTAPGLVIVRDADHAWPAAYVAVFDHPYYAVTGANGSFTIDGVPPGRYTLMAWHERTGRKEQPVEVTAGGQVKVGIELAGK